MHWVLESGGGYYNRSNNDKKHRMIKLFTVF